MKFKWNSMKFDKIQMKFKFILMTIQVQFNENSSLIQWNSSWKNKNLGPVVKVHCWNDTGDIGRA